MSDVRPSKPSCHACGHLVDYHRGPRCLGSIAHAVGVFEGDEDRCPCTLSPIDAQVPAGIASPRCPFCDGEPYAAASPTQWLCANDDCPCFMWNPAKTVAENRRDATPLTVTDNAPGGED